MAMRKDRLIEKIKETENLLEKRESRLPSLETSYAGKIAHAEAYIETIDQNIEKAKRLADEKIERLKKHKEMMEISIQNKKREFELIKRELDLLILKTKRELKELNDRLKKYDPNYDEEDF